MQTMSKGRGGRREAVARKKGVRWEEGEGREKRMRELAREEEGGTESMEGREGGRQIILIGNIGFQYY